MSSSSITEARLKDVKKVDPLEDGFAWLYSPIN